MRFRVRLPNMQNISGKFWWLHHIYPQHRAGWPCSCRLFTTFAGHILCRSQVSFSMWGGLEISCEEQGRTSSEAEARAEEGRGDAHADDRADLAA